MKIYGILFVVIFVPTITAMDEKEQKTLTSGTVQHRLTYATMRCMDLRAGINHYGTWIMRDSKDMARKLCNRLKDCWRHPARERFFKQFLGGDEA